jgi:Domain of unknown function (DUF4304)
MDAALKRDVLPVLRSKGFKGTFPRLRRHAESGIDLLTFQFDSGGFIIEIARSPREGVVTHWGKIVPATKLTAWDVHPTRRNRITATAGKGTDGWFRFDASPIDRIVALVIEKLSADDLWNDLGPTGSPEEQHLPL